MIQQMEKNEIIVKYRNGVSIRQISKETNISRVTVTKYINNYKKLLLELSKETDAANIAAIQEQMCSRPKRKVTVKKRIAFTADVEKRFNEILEFDKQKNEMLGTNKQRLTGTKIHQILISEGFNVGLTTVLNEFRKFKNKNRECFIRQDYEYGFRTEFDFHQVKLKVAGIIKTYHQVTIVSPKSDHIFELLYPNEKTDVVIESIIQYINHCGGVFKQFAFDNMKTVVRQIYKSDKEYTDEIIKLSTYYGFSIFTCNPRSGNEKGSVENGGKYTRNDIFSTRITFKDEEELLEYHQKELEKLNKKYDSQWEIEKKHLLPKPPKDYIIQTLSKVKVNSYSCICYANNFYSVPDKYVGYEMDINVFSDNLVIYYQGLEVARHTKIKGFHEYKIVLDHYLSTFMKKPAALEHSVALKQAPEELKNIFKNDYNMDAKKFIKDLLDNNLLKSQNINEDEITKISNNQLNVISNIYGA